MSLVHADVLLVVSVAYLWFKVPIRGNLLVLFFSMLLYLMATLGVGVFISTISRTQQQAMMSTVFFYMPAILLSGFIFPIENMPKIYDYISMIMPPRYFIVIIKNIMIKGTGLQYIWKETLILIVMTIVFTGISVRKFKIRLE